MRRKTASELLGIDRRAATTRVCCQYQGKEDRKEKLSNESDQIDSTYP